MNEKEYPCIRCGKDQAGPYIDLLGNIVCYECYAELKEDFLEYVKGQTYIFFGCLNALEEKEHNE